MAREFAADAATPPPWLWWVFVVAVAVGLVAMPYFTDVSLQLDLSIVFVLALLALSMGFLWGYVGILSFGQTIFFIKIRNPLGGCFRKERAHPVHGLFAVFVQFKSARHVRVFVDRTIEHVIAC